LRGQEWAPAQHAFSNRPNHRIFTPAAAQRILASPHVSRDVRERVKCLMAQYDCYTLKCLVQEKLQAFFTRYVDGVQEMTTIPVAAPASSALQAAPTGTEAGPATGTQHYDYREKIPA